MKKVMFSVLLLSSLTMPLLAQQSLNGATKPPKGAASSSVANQVRVANGWLEGTVSTSGIREFKGVPYAAPPVGALRWREPQPVAKWSGVRPATQFGPRAMQLPVFGDMNFRSNGVSEDCLYLNVWAPAAAKNARVPVLVYFYGGGFIAGDGSEPRYDGEAMARRGIVAVTVNYRLGVFGFLAHPELTQESPHHASGNYGLLDQAAALRWVEQNIAAFGGDPQRVTIAGESAGSMSVSAQMVSPLAKDLIAGAIGESGSLLNLSSALLPLAEAEQQGGVFAASVGAPSLAALRALPTQQLLEAAGKPDAVRFGRILDGYFLPQAPSTVFAAGQQAHVPLLVGWNSREMGADFLLGTAPPTLESYRRKVQELYGARAEDLLKLYPATTDQEAEQAATDLAGDRFLGYSTWKWADLQAQTGGKPVYRYLFARPRPVMTAEMGNAKPGLAGGVIKQDAEAPKAPPVRGAVHSAEIEYALGNLATNKVYAWTPNDYKVSETMQAYFANFIKTGTPNGKGLPDWPAMQPGTDAQFMLLDVTSRAEREQHRARYLFLDQQAGK